MEDQVIQFQLIMKRWQIDIENEIKQMKNFH